jgi:hypothetical protein
MLKLKTTAGHGRPKRTAQAPFDESKIIAQHWDREERICYLGILDTKREQSKA